jgi:hypothetical protein
MKYKGYEIMDMKDAIGLKHAYYHIIPNNGNAEACEATFTVRGAKRLIDGWQSQGHF